MYNKTTRNTGAGVMYDRGESPRYNRNGIQVKDIKILKNSWVRKWLVIYVYLYHLIQGITKR